MEIMATLYKLQQAKLEKNKLDKEIKKLQADEDLKNRKEDLSILEEKYNSDREEIAALGRELKRQEDYSVKLSNQRQDYEQRLYGGTITNSKELEQLQKKVIQIQKEEVQVEEKILEWMMALDEKREKEELLGIKLKESRRVFEKAQKDYQERYDRLKERQNAAQQELDELSAKVDKRMYARYNAIAQKAGGIGIVSVDSGVCGGCQVTLSAVVLERVREGKDVVTCENCGRLLYCSE